MKNCRMGRTLPVRQVFWDHQTLGGFPKVKEGSSRGFDGK